MHDTVIKGTAALTKGLSVIQTVADAEEPITAVEIAEKNNLPLPTLQRILSSLVANGFVVRIAGKRTYRIGPAVLSWAQHTWANLDVRLAAESPMQALRDEAGEAVQLAMLAGSKIVTIDRLDGSQPISLYSSVGKIGPIHCTATGKAILAGLPEAKLNETLENIDFVKYTQTTIVNSNQLRKQLEDIRKKGYSIDNQEHQEGVVCIAAPILDYRGTAVAAVSVTAPVFRLPIEKLVKLVPMLSKATSEITEVLGGRHL